MTLTRLIDTTRVKKLNDWLEHELPTYFHGRILPIDNQVADRWDRLLADAGRLCPWWTGYSLPLP
jgi:hypothetical protein